MDITIQPGRLSGTVHVIPSKSQAHRLLICAAFADSPTKLICPEINRDIAATVQCLNALGAAITRTDIGYEILPIAEIPQSAELCCCESGSTVRFLLPIVGALGIDATFLMEGRLPYRPLSPLWEEMERMGCKLSWMEESVLAVKGKLRPGDYYIDGGISSQFITGLLFAAALMDGDSTIHLLSKLESAPYVEMTQQAMALFGIDTADLHVRAGQKLHSPGCIKVEADWSNAAFWLSANSMGSEIKIPNLDPNSPQGDRKVAKLAQLLSENISISVSDIPDLVPILSVIASVKKGAVFTNIRRLRLKESDRAASTVAMIENLGGKAEATEDTLTVYGTGLSGGTVDAMNDHRIAMAAAIAATACRAPVTILGAQCVEKSYPRFWEEYKQLGGQYEQLLR